MPEERATTGSNFSENCKKLMEHYDDWIIEERQLKWQDVPKDQPTSIITDRKNGVALMAHYGQLGEAECAWIKINMHDAGLKNRLFALASEKEIKSHVADIAVNVVFKFVKHKGP